MIIHLMKKIKLLLNMAYIYIRRTHLMRMHIYFKNFVLEDLKVLEVFLKLLIKTSRNKCLFRKKVLYGLY